MAEKLGWISRRRNPPSRLTTGERRRPFSNHRFVFLFDASD